MFHTNIAIVTENRLDQSGENRSDSGRVWMATEGADVALVVATLLVHENARLAEHVSARIERVIGLAIQTHLHAIHHSSYMGVPLCSFEQIQAQMR